MSFNRKAEKAEYYQGIKMKKEEAFDGFMAEAGAIYESIVGTSTIFNIPNKRLSFVVENEKEITTRLEGMLKKIQSLEKEKMARMVSRKKEFSVLSVPPLTLESIETMNRSQLGEQREWLTLASILIDVRLELKDIKTQKGDISMAIGGVGRATKMKRHESDGSADSINDDFESKLSKKGKLFLFSFFLC